MRSKPMRKDPNKERIFSQRQNIQDFDYIQSHRGKVDGQNPKLLEKEIHHCGCGECSNQGNCR